VAGNWELDQPPVGASETAESPPLLLPLSPVVPPSPCVPPSGAPPSDAGLHAMPPMAARPMARRGLEGTPHVWPAPHSAFVVQSWTGPPSN
jgi:hypothetical protein